MTVKKVFLCGIGPLIGIVLFAAASVMLSHTLAQYSLRDILTYLHELPTPTLLLALGCVSLSYLTMIGYDVLAMRYINRSLPWRKVGLAAFISYAFSTALGLSVLTSGSLRYRFYSRWGLTLTEVTQVVIFTALTVWLGILTIGGGMLIVNPPPLPTSPYLPTFNSTALGGVMLALPLAYWVLNAVWCQPLQIGRWALPRVRPDLAALQIGVGTLDWLLASTVLYVLLPSAESLNFGYFLGFFLVAQTAGLISHVPGGLGVFESLMLLMLSAHLPAPQVFGALLIYRVIFYWLPLGLATLSLGAYEGWGCQVYLRKRVLPKFGAVVGYIRRAMPVAMPSWGIRNLTQFKSLSFFKIT